MFLLFKDKIEVGSFMNFQEHGEFCEPDITFPFQWGGESTEISGQHFPHSYSTETVSFCRVPWTDANGEFISYAKLTDGNWNGAATKGMRPFNISPKLSMELWKMQLEMDQVVCRNFFYGEVEACYEFMGGNIHTWVVWGFFLFHH